MQEKSTMRFSMGIFLIIAGSLSRLIPHAPNFTAVGATALLAGAIWGLNFRTILIPLATLALTDALVFGMHSTLAYVYLAYLLTTVLAAWALKKRGGMRILGVSLISSLIFFTITNFGVWFSAGMYSLDFKGLVECFVMALPFFRNQVVGDLCYSILLFAVFEFFIHGIQWSLKASVRKND